MTLSRFLRDYLYFSLGGNRKGSARRYLNLMITMLLGGLWHGAGWNYVAWGGLHGVYLVINHGWQAVRVKLGHDMARSTPRGRALAQAITLLAVIVGWVLFRAADLNAAREMLAGMCGLRGVALPSEVMRATGALAPVLQELGVKAVPGGGMRFAMTYAWVLVLWVIALAAPNTARLLGRENPALDYASILRATAHPASRPGPEPSGALSWRPTRVWAACIALVTASGLLSLNRVTEFLYFQF
jgi:hypothetical protein